MKTLPAEESPRTPWPAERTGTTYDVAGLLVEAVSTLHEQLGTPSKEVDTPSKGVETPSKGMAPHRAAVAQQLREATFQGATGKIDFRTSHIGNERNLAVLRVSDLHDLDAAPTCAYRKGGRFDPQQPRDPDTGCPE
ncbi:hypothetical protein ACWDZ4_12125 [Streptomyces sp. NPDC003016]